MSVYDLQKALRLYLVTDSRWLDGRELESCVEQAIAGGITFLQLRDKSATTDELTEQARQLLPLCKRAGVPFVINDDIDAAIASGADGVHVGQTDASCANARAALGPDAIVGVSVQTVEQAIEAQKQGASYLGVGAMFATSTKDDANAVSLDTLADICSAVDIPVVAIGGIENGNIKDLSESGIAGIAVVSAILASPDIKLASEKLSKATQKLLG